MEERRQWNDIFKVLRENICQSRILYPEKNILQEWKCKRLFKKRVERFYHHQILTKGNTKWNPSGRRKVIPDGMLKMQEGIKHNKKIQYLGKSK